MTEKTAKLTVGDESWDFPVRSGSIGPDVGFCICVTHIVRDPPCYGWSLII